MSRRKGKGAPRSRAPKVQSRKRPAPTQPRKPGVYVPTDVTPEELFQAIGRLRKDARDEIDRLIQFLDKTDDYVSRELEDQVDDSPCDDNELDGPENGEDEESDPAEPSLGAPERSASCYGPDGHNPTGSQTNWADGRRDDLEDQHDGAEPDDNEGGDGAKEDDEPSLGWTLNGQMGQSNDGDDREIGGSIAAEDQTNWVGSGGHDTGMAPAAMKAMRERYKRFDRNVTNADGKHI